MYNTRADILTRIGRPNGTTSVVVNMHNTSDIINQMQKAHYDNSAFAKKIAYKFKGSTVKQTCRNIFNWLKENIEYRIEPAHLQTTKSLQRLVSDGYGDCKHYSGFFAAILSALNIKHHYRFTSYNNSTTPTHVYVVAYDENNQPIYCDAVLEVFNTQKNFTHKIDKNMLAHLGSIDAIGKPKAQRQAAKAARVEKREIRKENRPAIIKKVVAAPKKAIKAVAKGTTVAAKKVAQAAAKVPAGAKKVSIAPARAAFLALVLLNLRGFATKLSKANQNELKNKWNNLGGDFGKLQDAINKGKSKKAILAGIDGEDNLGSVAAASASLAAATPIIIALNNFLKEGSEAIDKGKKLFQSATGQKVEETPFSQDKDLFAPATEVEDGGQVQDSPAQKSTTGSISPLLLIGGAALAYFAFKKK
jgi:hypothetical protein